MQVYPLPLHHADMISAGTVYIIAIDDSMIRGYPHLPAVQELSLPDLLVTEQFPAAGGAVDGDYG